MFLLHFLPDWLLSWAINLTLIIGIVGVSASYVAKYIPIVNIWTAPYRGLIQIIGIVCLTAGVYFKGGESTELQWRARVAEQQQKIELAEAKSREANKQLSEEIKKNQKLTKEVKDAVTAGIKANAGKMDSQCTVDSIAIELHNRSSLNQVPRSTSGTTKDMPSTSASRPNRSQVK